MRQKPQVRRRLLAAPDVPAAATVAPTPIDKAMIQPLAVTPQDACRMLSIGLTRFYELLGQGEFDDFRVGRSRRITIASIHAYIERQRTTTRFRP